MDCPNCQSAIPDNATFCTYCGASVGSSRSRKGRFISIGIAVILVAVIAGGGAFFFLGGSRGEPIAEIPLTPPSSSDPMSAGIRSAQAETPPTPSVPTAAGISSAQAETPPISSVPTAAGMGADRAAPVVTAPTDRANIIFADLNWTSAQVQNRIAQFIIEYGYGYQTAVIPGRTEDLFQKLRNGEIDVSMEVWLPLQQADWLAAQSSGEVIPVGSSMGQDWQSTFVIPAYLQEEYPGLDHVDDLKDPVYRELFANASSGGRARLLSCPVGWACLHKNEAQIAGYGLEEHLQVVKPDSQEDLFNDLFISYSQKDTWLGYMWGTADPALLLDLVQLKETPYSDECNLTHKACAFSPTTILTAVTSGLEPRAPALIHLLQQWRFNIPEYQKVLIWMEENKASQEDGARYWLRNESATWKRWVTEDAAAKIEAALAADNRPHGWP